MIIPSIINRRSIRKFQNKPVPEKLVNEVIKAAQFAPTSRDNRLVEFVVVNNPETKKKIYEAAIPPQEFLLKAPVLVIPVTDPSKTNQPVQDISLATANIFLQAAELGLGTVWKNLKPPAAGEIKKILKIPEEYLIINIIPLGYPAETPDPHTDDYFQPDKIHPETW
jgi:nitroreductase